MQINKYLKYGYLTGACIFQLYLAFASILYLDWRSYSFAIVLVLAICSVATIGVYILVKYERIIAEEYTATMRNTSHSYNRADTVIK